MITVQESDLRPGSGEITHLLNDPGVSLSIQNLMELMLLISDNSAADIPLRTAGGAPAVNARLAELGIAGISVDAGHVVVAAFVKESKADAATQERAIAHVARSVCDYFVLCPGAR